MKKPHRRVQSKIIHGVSTTNRIFIYFLIYGLVPLSVIATFATLIQNSIAASKAGVVVKIKTDITQLEEYITIFNETQTCYNELSDKGFVVDSYGEINDTSLEYFQTLTNTTCGQRYVRVVTTDLRTDLLTPVALSGDMSKHAIAYDGSWHDYGQFTGDDGIECWDLDENGLCNTTTEDTNSDGICDASDCKGIDGLSGQTGLTGVAGYVRQPGVFSYDCGGITLTGPFATAQCRTTNATITAMGVSGATPDSSAITITTNGTWIIMASIELTSGIASSFTVNSTIGLVLEIRDASGTLIESVARTENVINRSHVMDRTMMINVLYELGVGYVLRLVMLNDTGGDILVPFGEFFGTMLMG